jgi:hypothetical protein
MASQRRPVLAGFFADVGFCLIVKSSGTSMNQNLSLLQFTRFFS